MATREILTGHFAGLIGLFGGKKKIFKIITQIFPQTNKFFGLGLLCGAYAAYNIIEIIKSNIPTYSDIMKYYDVYKYTELTIIPLDTMRVFMKYFERNKHFYKYPKEVIMYANTQYPIPRPGSRIYFNDTNFNVHGYFTTENYSGGDIESLSDVNITIHTNNYNPNDYLRNILQSINVGVTELKYMILRPSHEEGIDFETTVLHLYIFKTPIIFEHLLIQ